MTFKKNIISYSVLIQIQKRAAAEDKIAVGLQTNNTKDYSEVKTIQKGHNKGILLNDLVERSLG